MEDLKIMFVAAFVGIIMVAGLSLMVDASFKTDYDENPTTDELSTVCSIHDFIIQNEHDEVEEPEKVVSKPLTRVNKQSKDKVYEISEVDILPHFGKYCKNVKSKSCTIKNIHAFIEDEIDLSDIEDYPFDRTEIVEFVVDSKGHMSDVKYVRSTGDDCKNCPQAAVNAIGKMVNWEAGSVDGKAVPVRLRLPIKFAFGQLASR